MPRTDPDLDAELDDFLKRPERPCKYARVVPDDLKVRIRAKVDQGAVGWIGFSRFLAAKGIVLAPKTIEVHFERTHDDSC